MTAPKLLNRVLNKAQRVLGLTYDQRLEAHLLKINARVKSPVFVKVGANDGLTGDPCGEIFLKNRHWRGLLIEPVPYCVERLKQTYDDSSRFSILPCAISDTDGQIEFYYVSEEAGKKLEGLPPYYDQLGSFNRAHIVSQLNGVLEPYIVSSPVEVRALANVIRDSGLERIDLLHIDTEGHDWRVLKTFDFSKFQPSLIIVEQMHLAPDERTHMRDLLVASGYRVLTTPYDFIAMKPVSR